MSQWKLSHNIFVHQVVSALLEYPAIQVNQRTREGWTALVAAADKGHHTVVRALLQHPDTDPNTRDNQGGLVPC
jgi:ankyrin repeat protein